MATRTVENYVKQIYVEQQRLGGRTSLVPTGRLAEAMAVAPGTATGMVKTLADAGLVDYEPRGGVRLTPPGEKLALHVLRRHRIIEAFLVDMLKMDWSEVHDEAEELEHAVSDKVLERLDELLGRPRFDPHGDPIPNSMGLLDDHAVERLCDVAAGRRGVISRITDQDSAFLTYADSHGLVPGAVLVIERQDAAADAVVVRVGEQILTLGTAAAAKILLRP